jgi:hypothetical protein
METPLIHLPHRLESKWLASLGNFLDENSASLLGGLKRTTFVGMRTQWLFYGVDHAIQPDH